MNGGLPVGLLALVCAMLPAPANAEADDQEECEQVRQLNNDQGYTPCEVARRLIAPCYPQLDSSQTFNARGWLSAHANSTCSCNSVVYDLLNACELCRDEGPMGFSDWTSKCGPHNVTITNYYPIANVAVHIPAWAYTDIASDKFNEQEVRDNKWSPIQIATPLIAGLVVLLLCGAAFWWYRARHRPPAQHRTTYPPKRWCLSDLLRRGPSPVVHSRLHSWADTDAERPQHPSRLSSYSDGESVRGIDHKPFLGKIFAGKGPVPLHSLPRRQGFRIDDTDVSTKAASRSSTVVIGAHAGADEQSVLLISRTPGVDFSIESTTVHSPRTERTAHSPRTERTVHSPRTERTEGGMTGVSLDVEPPSPLSPGLPNPHSDPATPEYSPCPSPSPHLTYVHLPPMNRGDPSNLIPAPVRAAGYDPFRASMDTTRTHSRNASAESLYWYGSPDAPHMPPGNLSARRYAEADSGHSPA